MFWGFRSAAAALVTLALVLPVAAQDGGEATETDEIAATPGSAITFYGHIFGFGRGSPMPMNTEFPEGEGDYSIGTAGGCGVPPPLPEEDPTGEVYGSSNEDCEAWASNEEFFYTTAGFVQVSTWEEWDSDYSLFHNERGQTKDIYLDTSQQASSTFWMSADWHGWLVTLCDAMCWNWDPGAFQDWVVESWIWHANLGEWAQSPSDAPDVSAVAMRIADDQTLIANGKTEPVDMVSLDATIPGGERTVWPFEVQYEWDPDFDGRVPYLNDLIVEFEWYQETDGHKYIIGGGVVWPNWNVNAGEDYPPSVVLPVRNPLDVELVFPRFVHDKLVILTVINTPWGSYDIDPALTSITIQDAAGNEVQMQEEFVTFTLDSSVAHAGHYKPINATWVWDYQAQGLEPGDYTITIEATNYQHSYTTSTTAGFAITKEGLGGATETGRSGLQSFTEEQLGEFQEGAEKQVGETGLGVDADTDGARQGQDDEGIPGPALPLALLLVAAVAVLLRRRD